jgi:signal transduction histidine kinase
MGSDDLEMGYTLLYKNYKLSNTTDSVLKYQELALLSKDSTNKKNVENLTELQKSSFAEQQRLQLLEQEKELSENRMRNYGMFGILFVFFGVGILLYRNNKREQKAKQKIEKAYDDLKSTQSQLIQSEKMASLGELTAGIAHEIQNPLNFVNNFSEVSNELLVEMKEELEKGNLEDVKAITDDVQHNLEKILHHGKRADAIVKGMLQHSRSSSGKKEPADINVLADEYLRLAYHGLRAKDKSFNSKMETDFDQTIGKINVIPQDIGRVILNLITNAFYVVDEKKKSGLANYDPMVSVSTKKLGEKIEISVKDNGNGIPEKVLDKIFQPFFTTKPTGQGTGLGLSLSYDIVKAHGGDLKVETKEGEGSEFVIQLPIV